MEDEYLELISFARIKEAIVQKRTTVKYVAQDAGITPVRLSQIINGTSRPKVDILAKLSYVLKVPVSELVEFKGIEPNEAQAAWFEKNTLMYTPSEEATGELSYEPLREMMGRFLDDINYGRQKNNEPLMTEKDVFDGIEPYRRKAGIKCNFTDEDVDKSLSARGLKRINEGDKKIRENKGLPQRIRTRLRNDKPINVVTVYDICKKFGCSIDWVIGYK